MPGGLQPITQDSFSSGIFQSVDTQRIPASGSFDIQNGLLDSDEGVVYRRGGGAYLSNVLTSNGTGGNIWDLYLAAGSRTVYHNGGKASVLSPDDLTATLISDIGGTAPGVAAGIAWFAGGTTVLGWAGYRGSGSAYSTGTVALNTGSATMTGTGTTWLTNVQPGYVVGLNVLGRAVAVKSVDSNTTITLAAPWDGNNFTGLAYTAGTTQLVSISNFAGMTDTSYAASAGGRLLFGRGSQIVFSVGTAVPGLGLGTTTNLHQIPNGAQIVGLRAVRDTVLVSTTKGVYTISNLSLDLTDANGNPQQRLERLTGSVILWGEAGLASSDNSLVAPALDDIYLIDGVSSPVPISRSIRGLYRGYVKAGYVPGGATVFRGHYILPILNSTGSTWIDTLICELATGAWTRLSGLTGASLGFVARASTPAKLLSLIVSPSVRVLDNTGWWTPTAANKNEPDGSTHAFSVTTRDFSAGNVAAFFKKLRLWTEGVAVGADNPTVTASYAEGPAGTAFTAMSGTAGPSTGDTPAGVFSVNSGGRRVRFQITSTSPWASLKLKALDVFVRSRGRA